MIIIYLYISFYRFIIIKSIQTFKEFFGNSPAELKNYINYNIIHKYKTYIYIFYHKKPNIEYIPVTILLQIYKYCGLQNYILFYPKIEFKSSNFNHY
jgi:hypothetical protein